MPGNFQLPRDPATDQSRPVEWSTVEPVNPDGTLARIPSGRQVSLKPQLTPVGRTGFWKTRPVMVQARDGRAAAAKAISPGTIRRNVTWPVEETGGRSLFSWAGNAAPDHGRFFQVTGVTEYVISSLALQLARPLKWVITGQKPALAKGVDQQVQIRRFRGYQQASGWPMIAPAVPSYGARVPLLRPRGLVSNQ
jgi:hypothetical protein